MILTMKAPGRIVLFGEHQDYLGLPVIPAAVDLFMTITGEKTNSRQYHIELPDIQDIQSFLATNTRYKFPRDYLRSGVKVLQENEIIPHDQGVSARVTSDIPMQAGLSSSSALCVIWISFLAELFDNPLSQMEITRFAHQAEVLEFNEPGGMQDHMVISHGYVNYEEFDPIKCTRLLTELPGIVIGNSLEKKDTLNTLATIKNGVRRGLRYLQVSKVRELTIKDVKELNPIGGELDEFSLNALKSAVINYELTRKAHLEFKKSSWNEEYIGTLMNRHHTSLRDHLNVSTPKIEVMIKAAMNAGALGCKITGSGNGGCMIALCPGHEEEVSRSIQKQGAEVHIARVVSGVSKVIK
ncbi:MAG: mevalonate kinase [Promethearchaeota archaeon]